MYYLWVCVLSLACGSLQRTLRERRVTLLLLEPRLGFAMNRGIFFPASLAPFRGRLSFHPSSIVSDSNVQTLQFACLLARSAVHLVFLGDYDASVRPGQSLRAWSSSVSTSTSATRRLQCSAAPSGQQAVKSALLCQWIQHVQYWQHASILFPSSGSRSRAAVAALLQQFEQRWPGEGCWMLEMLETAVLEVVEQSCCPCLRLLAPQCSLHTLCAPAVPLWPVVFSWPVCSCC
jgi:hypothetical protein